MVRKINNTRRRVKESSSPSDMGMKSLRRDFTGLSRDERKKKGYLYFTKHGLGPGTLPRDVDLVDSEDLDNYLTAIYLDRPLSSEELDYYDIYPETQNSRFMHLIKEGKRRGRRVKEDFSAYGPDDGSDWDDWTNDSSDRYNLASAINAIKSRLKGAENAMRENEANGDFEGSLGYHYYEGKADAFREALEYLELVD